MPKTPLELKSINIRIPTGDYPYKEFFIGARHFWHGELERLKYWNPSLSSRVDVIRSGQDEPFYMTVEYESGDRAALSNLKAQPFPVPMLKMKPADQKYGQGWKKAEEIKKLKPLSSFDRLAKLREAIPDVMDQIGDQLRLPGQPFEKMKDMRPVKITPKLAEHIPKDEIRAIAQPAADPSKPQSTSPPQTMYRRKITIPVAGLRHTEIWNWIRSHQNLPDHRTWKPAQNPDMEAHVSLERFRVESSKDKKRVKYGIDTMKREKRQLELARAAAAERAAENV